METRQCPICGQNNKCAAGTERQSRCWCFTTGKFPEGIFASIPQNSRGKRCICENCLNKYKQKDQSDNLSRESH